MLSLGAKYPISTLRRKRGAGAPDLPPKILAMILEDYSSSVVDALVFDAVYDARNYHDEDSYRDARVGNYDDEHKTPLRYLADKLYPSLHRTTDGSTSILTRETAIREAQLPRIRLALVCRSWRRAVIDHINTHPVVASSRQMLSFEHVLQDSPHIRIAQDLTCFNTTSPEGLIALSSIVAMSPSMDTLNIVLPYDSLEPRGLDILTFRIRKLTIHGLNYYFVGGWSPYWRSPNVALEILCLQYQQLHCWMTNFQKVMGALHTLQLVNVEVLKGGIQTISEIKSLRILELYATNSKRVPSYVKAGCFSLTNITQLVIGVVDGYSAREFRRQQWRAPPNLTSMTILVDMSPKIWTGKSFSEEKEPGWPCLEMHHVLRGLSNCEASLQSVLIVSQSNFRGKVDDPYINGRDDFLSFMRCDRSGRLRKQAALDYTKLLSSARGQGINVTPVWYDLNRFMNLRLSQKPGTGCASLTLPRFDYEPGLGLEQRQPAGGFKIRPIVLG